MKRVQIDIVPILISDFRKVKVISRSVVDGKPPSAKVKYKARMTRKATAYTGISEPPSRINRSLISASAVGTNVGGRV